MRSADNSINKLKARTLNALKNAANSPYWQKANVYHLNSVSSKIFQQFLKKISKFSKDFCAAFGVKVIEDESRKQLWFGQKFF